MLLSAVVFECKAPKPTDVFCAPVVFASPFCEPIKTFAVPVVVASPALKPTAVLEALEFQIQQKLLKLHNLLRCFCVQLYLNLMLHNL